ncbi:Bug family tripartite tricarboxylate transporter substrate binding protein [Paracandidimonas soli]|uniref:Bug family tripartite tricarboxylate transporter substrate binding protein n=1 Tax=Paracandidimonas soli TaxID=1917182 RepID=UPI0033413B63
MQRSHSTRRAHCIRLFCLGIFSAAVLGSAPTISHAQSAADYPSRALTLVSPFPPGGGNDGVGRLLAHEVSQILGQSIVVENRPGAGGNVGTSTVARSSPDGYTLVLAQNSIMAINPAIYAKPGFHPTEDFEPVSQITSAPLVLVVKDDSPYQTLNDYIADAEKRPGDVSYATPGSGTMSHLAGSILAKARSLDLMHVPYRGAGPAINDLLGGQVAMLITSPPSVEGLVREGKLRVLAATHENRVGVFAQSPTTASQGLPEISIEGWYGVFVPKGTPKDRIDTLHAAISKALKAPAVIEKIRSDGANVVGSSPDELRQTLAREIDYWKTAVRDTGIAIQ